MNLALYIQGIRKGREINRIEREAMRDSFLAEALEGYDGVKGNHPEQLEKLRKQISQKTDTGHNPIRNWCIAASFLIVIGLGVYFFLNNSQSSTESQLVEQSPVFLPEEIKIIEKDSDKVVAPAPVAPNQPTPNLASPYTTEETRVDTEQGEIPTDTSIPISGNREYEQYLTNNLIAPTDEDGNAIKGKVVLTFYVNDVGRPYEINVANSLSPSADVEAIRLIKEGPGWTIGDKEVTIEIQF
jgi:hypothetical protein